MMSAPCCAICRACAIATSESKNCPPSEKESGVTLRMPMTSGRRCASSACSGPSVKTACIAPLCGVAHTESSASRFRSVPDLRVEPFGRLDPGGHPLLRRQEPHPLVLLVGFAHRLREAAWIAVLQLPDRIDAGILEQFRIGLAHALDAHAIGQVGPAQHNLLIDADLF